MPGKIEGSRYAADAHGWVAPYRRGLRLLGGCMLISVLGACAQPPTLYNWKSYQPEVYAYLKEDGADYAAQAQVLEQNIETARSANQSLPPGFHAHLGMLYLKLGNGEKAVEQLQSEKLAFPESAPFMDFLLRNAKTPSAKAGKRSRASGSPAAGKTTPSVTTPTAAKSKKGAK